ncbi:MAG: penicillin-binding protein activator [Desulfobacteraceae bacterium]
MRSRLCLNDRAIFTIAVGVALFVLGCQPKPVIKKPPEMPPGEALFASAELDFGTGNYDRAAEGYERYRERYPQGKRARTALYRIGQIYILGYEHKKALPHLQRFIREYPDDPESPAVAHEIAKIYYRLGDYEKSKTEALDWLGKYPEHSRLGESLLLLGKNYKALLDNPKALYWWLRASEAFYESPERQKEIEEIVVELIESTGIEGLEQMAGYATGTKFAPPIHYKIAAYHLEENRLKEAKFAAMALVRSTPEQFWVNIGRRILEKVSKELSVKKDVIGCLLPLSGPFAIYGREVLNGIELGMGLFDRPEEGQGLELLIEDTRAEAEVVVSRLEALAEQGKVIAVIGPLASKPALAASRKAQELGLPIITLTQRDGITAEGEVVFRNFVTPSKEIETLLDKAQGEMGLSRFGILYPDNRYGRFFMNLFWDRVEELGGSINAVESYKPDETDFAVQIKKMVGLFYPRPEPLVQFFEAMKYPPYEVKGAEVELDPEEEPPPIVDFDAVFIPDSYQQVALAAPQFPFHNIFNVYLLGTSLWQSSELLETAGDYVQGAIFPSGFFAGSESQTIETFVRLYEENFESEPGILAATGYDTIRFLKDVLNENTIATRKDFQKALLRHDNFRGVTGKISFDQEREVEKEPTLLSVRGRRLVTLP